MDDDEGNTACAWTIEGPWKKDFETVATAAGVQCTEDVFYVQGVLYLYRGAGHTLIGSDAEGGGTIEDPRTGAGWYQDGRCAASTYQYQSQLVYSIVSSANGGANWSHWSAIQWISC